MVADQTIHFTDQIAGDYHQNLASEVGDFVLKRRDSLYAYQLATVVDDIDMRVTDVLRGADLLDSSPRQIALFHALGHSPPRFWHVPLLCDENGHRLSKRDGADSLQSLRQAGNSADQIIAQLAKSLGLCQDSAISAKGLLSRLKEDRS